MVVFTKLPRPTVRLTVSTGVSLLLFTGLDWIGADALAAPTSRQRVTTSRLRWVNRSMSLNASPKDLLPPPPPYTPMSPPNGSTNIQVIPPPPTSLESVPPAPDSLPALDVSSPGRVESLTVGSSGAAVEGLQAILRSYGYNVVVDGAYGPQTAQAVRAYQQDVGLSITGTADQATLASLGVARSDSTYVAAIILGWANLATVQQVFPDAERAQSRLGEFISIGRFRSRGDAEARVDLARQRGFSNTRVIYD